MAQAIKTQSPEPEAKPNEAAPKQRKPQQKNNEDQLYTGKKVAPAQLNEKTGKLQQEQGKRRIGRWYIGETLGKGGYSWVKRGVDRKNGRIVALKFIERKFDKKKNEWKKSQQTNIKNEIEALKMLRHDNIIRLLAYNLNAKYPDRSGKSRDVILLVLEHAAGGELFDILYYTEKLEPILARTYFQQLIAGVEECHAHGIIHRDIKPQNLLLDQRYTLKITDFGLSKIDPDKNSDVLMDDWHVATRGYQAPEVLLRQNKYTKKVDIFAIGVVLFILLGGYPPFEHAKESDKWYQYIVQGKYKNFWKSHRNCGLKQSETDLITRMICYDPAKRITIPKIKKHPWYTSKEILRAKDLVKVLRYRHSKMEITRNADPNKQRILSGSAKRRTLSDPLLAKIKACGLTQASLPPKIPEYEEVNARDIFTQSGAYHVLQCMQSVIENDLHGTCLKPNFNEIFDMNENDDNDDRNNDEQNKTVNADDDKKEKTEQNNNENKEEEDDRIRIDCKNFSIAFEVALQDLEIIDKPEKVAVHVQLYWMDHYRCNLVKFRRMQGDSKAFNKLIEIIEKKAAAFLTGLPAKKKHTGPLDALAEDAEFVEIYEKCFPQKNKLPNENEYEYQDEENEN